MKRASGTIMILVAGTVIAAAAWILGPAEPHSLPEAYNHAIDSLGSLTNDFQCIEARRDEKLHWWNFTFEDTNAAAKSVFVYDFLIDGDPKTRVSIIDGKVTTPENGKVSTRK
jgi:hypothetical protein